MKRHLALLLVILASSLALAAQQQADQKDEPQKDQQQEQNQQQQQEEKRPTLGPDNAPNRQGPEQNEPETDYVLDASRLMRVRKIYVEQIDNNLSQKLMEGLAKSGRFRIVLEKKDADAVIHGTCLDARRLRTVHSEVFMSDRVTGKSIWQDNVHVPYNPPPLSKAVDKTADEILRHLANSVAHPQPH